MWYQWICIDNGYQWIQIDFKIVNVPLYQWISHYNGTFFSLIVKRGNREISERNATVLMRQLYIYIVYNMK